MIKSHTQHTMKGWGTLGWGMEKKTKRHEPEAKKRANGESLTSTIGKHYRIQEHMD